MVRIIRVIHTAFETYRYVDISFLKNTVQTHGSQIETDIEYCFHVFMCRLVGSLA